MQAISQWHVDHAELAIKPLQVLITGIDFFFDLNSLWREADIFPQTMTYTLWELMCRLLVVWVYRNPGWLTCSYLPWPVP